MHMCSLAISGIRQTLLSWCDNGVTQKLVVLSTLTSQCHLRDTSTCPVWGAITTSGWKQTAREAGKRLKTGILP